MALPSFAATEPAQPQSAPPNHLKILLDGDKLQIDGRNVDLEGIGTLRKMLEKYEEIIKLQKGEK